MNSLYQQLNQSNSTIPNGIRQTISRFKALTNPREYIQSQLQSNPQLQSIIQASNGNYEQAFRNLAAQMNVNANEIINMLK